MGIRFHCPQCQHRLHVKSFLAGKRGVCPKCGAKLDIPSESELPEEEKDDSPALADAGAAHAEITQHARARAVTVAPTARTRTNGPAHNSPDVGGAQDEPPLNEPLVAPAVPRPKASSAKSTNATAKQPALPQQASSTPAPAPSVADPLQEAPNSVWYVRPPSGGQYGPARSEIMQRWIDEGRVTADSLVWREGWPEWRLAGEALPKFQPASAENVAGGAVTPLAGAAGSPKILPAPAIPAGAAASVMRYQKKKRERRGIWTAAVVVLSVLAVVLIVTLIIVLNR